MRALSGRSSDLAEAVRVALERDGFLLTAGEALVAGTWLSLPASAASLYARLLDRRRDLFPLDRLQLSYEGDVAQAAAELISSGFAWDAHAIAPAAAWAHALTGDELRTACRKMGRSATGRRADLEARMADARTELARPGIVPRHRGLFRRLVRLYLHDRHGDLSRIAVARIAVVRYARYEPMGGPGRYRTRAELIEEEEGRGPSARRHAAREAARKLEREGRFGEAAAAWRAIREGDSADSEAALRLAFCEAAAGDPAAGARTCRAARDVAEPVMERALDRTGRRLARRAGLGWAPLPPLRWAPERELRIGAWARGRPGAVEAAVVRVLAEAGRTALHGESAPWTSLFGLLFYEAIFAPVPGALPAPYMRGPLDLGTPAFAERRRELCERILADVAAGDSAKRVAHAIEAHGGEAIAGVRWDLASALPAIAAGLPEPALAALLRPFVEGWPSAGLPDLCVLPGPEVRLPAAFPSRLGPGLWLVEVKGPGDEIRDAQRVWLDRLLEAGVKAEVWRVAPD